MPGTFRSTGLEDKKVDKKSKMAIYVDTAMSTLLPSFFSVNLKFGLSNIAFVKHYTFVKLRASGEFKGDIAMST